ncbi:MAG: ATP-grasp domain-containing protein [Ginsengibacter sp.]
MKEICILGANERSCYSVVKSLKKEGNFITVIHDDFHSIKFSKYVDRFLKLNSIITRDTFAAKNEIIEYLKTNKVWALIPINDVAVELISYFSEEIANYTYPLNVNKSEVRKYSHDKYAVWKIANELGIPVPESQLISTYSQFQKLKSQIQFPLIVRPIYSKLIKGNRIFGYAAKRIENLHDLENFVREKINITPLMFQEILTGHGVGYNFLSKDGNILRAYAHERINEEWGGGQSTLRKSIPANKYNLESYSKMLVKAIKWSGIAMIEYKIFNNTPYLIEINGRPWGSLEVGIKAGVNLPSDLLKEFLEEDRNSVPNSNVGFKEVFVRNLYNELKWILKTNSPWKFIKWLFSLRVHFLKNFFIEDSIFSDFKFRSSFIINEIQIIFKNKFTTKRKLFFSLPTLSEISLKDIKSIAFVCRGNINRSAFAATYFKQNFAKELVVKSYGIHNEIMRMCPLNSIAVAREFGVDLSEHLSDVISLKKFAKIDLVVIMDQKNLQDLYNLNIKDNDKICRITMSPIKDPYGKDISEFRNCFLQIKNSIDSLEKKV